MGNPQKSSKLSSDKRLKKSWERSQFVLGWVFVGFSLIVFILFSFKSFYDEPYLLGVIAITLFLCGLILLRTNISPRTQVTGVTPPEGTLPKGETAIFTTKNILIGITILNAVLFTGGTILSSINIESVAKRASDAKKTIDTEQTLALTFIRGAKDSIETRINSEVDSVRNRRKTATDSIKSLLTTASKTLENFSTTIGTQEEELKILSGIVDDFNSGNNHISLIYESSRPIENGRKKKDEKKRHQRSKTGD